MAKVLCETELMENQKTGMVLPAPENFEAIQNAENHPLFFFIDGNKNFSLCAERSTQDTGWFIEALSTDLSTLNGGKTITAKTFDVTQNYETGDITIALVVEIAGDGNDHLYILAGLSNASDASWMRHASDRSWLARAYDGPTLSGDLDIQNVYMKASMESHIVCEIKNETTGVLSNFEINSTGTPDWTAVTGGGDYTTLLGQVIGKPTSAQHAGLYQLTENAGGATALNFLPMSASGTAISLTPPSGAARIANLVDGNGNTSLYVAADNAVYLFIPSAQTSGASGVKILEHALIAGVQDFHCHQNTNYTLIWCLNQLGQVFYSQCEKGKESDPKNWSTPLPLVTGVRRLSTYFSDSNDHSVIFVHKEGDELVQYTQDVDTTFWHERSILLPGQHVTDYVQAKTFTTHVQVNDDNNLPLLGQTLSITSSSPCSVYVNDQFCFLSPQLAIDVLCDARGTVTIIQETQNIGAVCYTIALKGGTGDPTVVNPMAKTVTKMATVTSGTVLGGIMVTNAQGVTSPLVGPGVSTKTKDAAANAIQNFATLAGTLPQNGGIQHDRAKISEILDTPYVARGFDSKTDKIWAISFDGEDGEYWEGTAALSQFEMTLDDAGTIVFPGDEIGGFWKFIKSTAGDIYQYCKHEVQEVKKFLVSHVGGVIQVFIRIGKGLYRFVANCMSDVVHAANVVFKKIQVAFEKLVEWLGFIFQWDDIKRSHQVTKNIVKQYLKSVPGNITSYKSGLSSLFGQIETELGKWAKLEQQPSWHKNFGGAQHSLGGIAGGASPDGGGSSPQSNYAVYHMNNGLKTSVMGHSGYTPPAITDQIKKLIAALKSAVDQEAAAVQKAIKAIEDNILGKLETLSFADLASKLIAIIGDLAIDSLETLIDATLDLIAVLIDGVVDILDTAIDVPIVSGLYKKMTGNDMSLLDALCFVSSMAATVVYKIAKGAAPFADNATTKSIIEATSWAAIQAAFNSAIPPLSGADVRTPDEEGATNFKAIATVFFHFVAGFGGCMVMLGAAAENSGSRVAVDTKVTAFFIATLPIVIAGLVNGTKQTKPVVMAETLYGLTCVQNLFSLAVGDIPYPTGQGVQGISGDATGVQAETPFATLWKKVSGGLDIVLGALSLVPPIWIAIGKGSKQNIAGAVTESCWNLNRMSAGAIAIAGGPSKLPRVFAFRMFSLAAYVGMNIFFMFFIDAVENEAKMHGVEPAVS